MTMDAFQGIVDDARCALAIEALAHAIEAYDAALDGLARLTAGKVTAAYHEADRSDAHRRACYARIAAADGMPIEEYDI